MISVRVRAFTIYQILQRADEALTLKEIQDLYEEETGCPIDVVTSRSILRDIDVAFGLEETWHKQKHGRSIKYRLRGEERGANDGN